jgi:hypothetical protein
MHLIVRIRTSSRRRMASSIRSSATRACTRPSACSPPTVPSPRPTSRLRRVNRSSSHTEAPKREVGWATMSRSSSCRRCSPSSNTYIPSPRINLLSVTTWWTQCGIGRTPGRSSRCTTFSGRSCCFDSSWSGASGGSASMRRRRGSSSVRSRTGLTMFIDARLRRGFP